METINIKNLPISSNNNLKTVIGFNENDELIKATYSNNGGGGVDLTDYYTKEEVYTKEQVDSIADNYYNDYMDDYRYLNGRIDNLENNGGGKESVVIDLGVTTEPNLTKEQIIEIADNFLSKKYTIKYVDTDESNTDYQLRLIDIIAVNDTRGGDDPAKYVELVGVTININIELLKWKFQQGYLTTPDSITLEKESLSKIVWEYLVPLMSNVSNLETKATDIENRAFNNVDSLENQIKANTDRLDNLENNGGGDVEPLVIEIQTNTITNVLHSNVKITTEQFFQLYNNLINFIKVTAPDGEATLHIIGSQKNHLFFIDGYNEYLYDITYYDFMDLHTLKAKTRFAPYNWVNEINTRLTTLENKIQELENKTN